MDYSLTLREADDRALRRHLFEDPDREAAAYLLCGASRTPTETRLLARTVILVRQGDIIDSSAVHMKIRSRSFVRVMKKADEEGECFAFVHSHPVGVPEHSAQDDREERKLFRTAYSRISSPGVHASVVFEKSGDPRGRVWLEDGRTRSMDVVRVVGGRFSFHVRPTAFASDGDFRFFDRQIRAFGPDLQRLLKILTIGVVGLGGTGSAVAEQLMRLGVGKIIAADPQPFEDSNVSRVYGSRVSDRGSPKVAILRRQAEELGLGTAVKTIPKSISFRSALEAFRDCDVVFGCTDDQLGRSLLMRFGRYYLIPVIDMGVRLLSKEGLIKDLKGRVTTLIPGSACLLCRERIRQEIVQAEAIKAVDPNGANALAREGYAPELDGNDPAVVTFTTAVAATAVTELLHRLTGFLGDCRTATEVLLRFDETKISKNSVRPRAGCACADMAHWGKGDRTPFLDSTWRPE